MLKRRIFWKRVLYLIAAFLLVLIMIGIYVVRVGRTESPRVEDLSSLKEQRVEPSPGFYTLKNNWFRKSQSGLYELYVEGNPFELGVVNGKLTKELIEKQEDYFNDQIRKMIPSQFYLHFLKYFIGWFNRDLTQNVTHEYKEEIYGISSSASDKYDYIGSNYQRILNYHAAHDIGHALQNLALVGCTSFGTWAERSEDSTLILGRNFDFYVGDKFAENKIVAFFSPTQGYKFMTVTWAGFIGAVSGMNIRGLTVTINAAKSTIPYRSATPVSLVAREILQYASNIDEALAIAKKRKMFVSESFLVGSAADNKAVVIEKTPDSLDVYDPNNHFIVSANHFQGKSLGNSKANIEQMNESASTYRYKRLLELLKATGKNTVQKTINILRDHEGLNNSDIGLGNEKAINQLIAHHSIVFEPNKLLVWVSTSPWQLGKFVAYDLNKVFGMKGLEKDQEVSESRLAIAADSFLLTREFKNFELFRNYKQRLVEGEPVNLDSLVLSNPEFYRTYELAGDFLYGKGHFQKALDYYRLALTKVIATKMEEERIKGQIIKCKEKI